MVGSCNTDIYIWMKLRRLFIWSSIKLCHCNALKYYSIRQDDYVCFIYGWKTGLILYSCSVHLVSIIETSPSPSLLFDTWLYHHLVNRNKSQNLVNRNKCQRKQSDIRQLFYCFYNNDQSTLYKSYVPWRHLSRKPQILLAVAFVV